MSVLLSLSILPSVFQIFSVLSLFCLLFIYLFSFFLLPHRDNDAPLEWLFNGLNLLGGAAVPINMLIMGGSLAKVWHHI